MLILLFTSNRQLLFLVLVLCQLEHGVMYMHLLWWDGTVSSILSYWHVLWWSNYYSASCMYMSDVGVAEESVKSTPYWRTLELLPPRECQTGMRFESWQQISSGFKLLLVPTDCLRGTALSWWADWYRLDRLKLLTLSMGRSMSLRNTSRKKLRMSSWCTEVGSHSVMKFIEYQSMCSSRSHQHSWSTAGEKPSLLWMWLHDTDAQFNTFTVTQHWLGSHWSKNCWYFEAWSHFCFTSGRTHWKASCHWWAVIYVCTV